MKALPILLGIALALTAVALAPTGAAACSYTQADPVVTGVACTSGDCHYDVLRGEVQVDCPRP